MTPEDPIAEANRIVNQLKNSLGDMARMHKKLYDAYIEAGFVPPEALYLVGQHIQLYRRTR